MNIGNNILKLRKLNGISQENLAEKLNISRQTISKWELGETTPDLEQAKKISMIFNVSLDELADNDIKDILTKKIINTEKLSGKTMKMLKIIGILIFIGIILTVIYKVIDSTTYAWFIGESRQYVCKINDDDYVINLEYYTNDSHNEGKQSNWSCYNCSYEQLKEIKSNINYNDLNETSMLINAYFKSLGGSCNN